jgi:(4-(4-[2-(gamma-L-glutamylamino)ethyl]phenoxymethyl)furan-2-yl)methanamine synthase
MSSIIGWDVGGAHLKAALVRDGLVVSVMQVPCELWRGMDRLETALDEVTGALGKAARHAVTTTGELVDYFPNRLEGVDRIVTAMARRLGGQRLAFYAGPRGFVTAEREISFAEDIASANWHATAALVASQIADALCIDFGSTTTDIVPIVEGSIVARGFNDHDRLVAGELVYMGLTRTPVAAVADRVPFRGRWSTMMNEYFATVADVWRVLDVLPPDLDQHSTADNRPKDRDASVARLGRMIGLDAGDAADRDWLGLASWLAEQQMRQIEDGIHLVQSACNLPLAAPVIAAGAGRFIVERIAARQNRRCIDFASLIGATGETGRWASTCAPAVAVALLLAARKVEPGVP